MKKFLFLKTIIIFFGLLIISLKNSKALTPADVVNISYECNKLIWYTNNEKNCSHFLMLFSRDLKSWSIIGQAKGAGDASFQNKYVVPIELKNVYFKIYQIDFDGTTTEYNHIYGACKN